MTTRPDPVVKKSTDDTIQSGRTTYDRIRSITDPFFSVLILLVLSPLILLVSIVIMMSGRGPVIYTQDRIGINGKPFLIYKFRSMIFNSETGHPQLSGNGGEKVTKFGRFLRKYRIDEIPNFINVIKGDITIVGPRPERQFFIDEILKTKPEFIELQKIKPGITSWGQVKFGYASNVQEMIERSKYDLYYLIHRSVWFDLKILLYTIIVIIKGKGI